MTGAAGAREGVAEERRLLLDDAAANVADAEGRKTCSVTKVGQQLITIDNKRGAVVGLRAGAKVGGERRSSVSQATGSDGRSRRRDVGGER